MSARKPINLREKRDIGQVVNASFAFLRISYFKMFRDILLFVSPFYIISGVCTSIMQFSYPREFGVPLFSYYLYPEFYVSLLSHLIGTTVCYAIVSNYVLQYVQTGSNQFNRSSILKRTWKQFAGLFTVNFFYYAANIGSLVFLIVPGIYFSIANVLSRPIYVIENVDDSNWISIGGSFTESRRLITDNWWRTFGLFYILYFLVAFMGLVFGIPVLVVTFLTKFNSLQGDGDMSSYRIYYTISEVVNEVGQCFLMPITIAAFCIYYYSLKESKDQTGLLESIENIGAKTAPESEYEGSY